MTYEAEVSEITPSFWVMSYKAIFFYKGTRSVSGGIRMIPLSFDFREETVSWAITEAINHIKRLPAKNISLFVKINDTMANERSSWAGIVKAKK
jgi:hypothetical protein